MFHFVASAFVSSLLISALTQVQATIYVTHPISGSQCTGGKACSIEWTDDGVAPLLSNIGATTVGLYNGNGVLIQQIQPVDVSVTHELEFTPDPSAGPNSGRYYIKFTAVNPIEGKTYSQFSTFFTMTGMSGSFDAPVSSDIASIPLPSSVASPPPNSISTIPLSVASPSVHPPSASAASSSVSVSHSGSSSASAPVSSVSLSRSASVTPSPSATAPSSSVSVSTSVRASSIPLSGSTLASSRSISSSSATSASVSASATGAPNGASRSISGQSSMIIAAISLLAVIILPIV